MKAQMEAKASAGASMSAKGPPPMAYLVIGEDCKVGDKFPVAVIVDGRPIGLVGELVLHKNMKVEIDANSWTTEVLKLHLESVEAQKVEIAKARAANQVHA
jgi:hypothetical protein